MSGDFYAAGPYVSRGGGKKLIRGATGWPERRGYGGFSSARATGIGSESKIGA